jgi:hypothetical protein
MELKQIYNHFNGGLSKGWEEIIKELADKALCVELYDGYGYTEMQELIPKMFDDNEEVQLYDVDVLTLHSLHTATRLYEKLGEEIGKRCTKYLVQTYGEVLDARIKHLKNKDLISLEEKLEQFKINYTNTFEEGE